MQKKDSFHLSFNGPTLVVQRVNSLEGFEGALHRKVIITQDGLWIGELQSNPEEANIGYLNMILDKATKLIGTPVHDICDLALVSISPQIGEHCAIITPNGIYASLLNGCILPVKASYGTQQTMQMPDAREHAGKTRAFSFGASPVTSPIVNIPGINYPGLFMQNDQFMRWDPTGRADQSPVPVINPTLPFEYRTLLDSVFRMMIDKLNQSYPLTHTNWPAPAGGYTSDDPEQHRFDMSSSQRDQQEIG